MSESKVPRLSIILTHEERRRLRMEAATLDISLTELARRRVLLTSEKHNSTNENQTETNRRDCNRSPGIHHTP